MRSGAFAAGARVSLVPLIYRRPAYTVIWALPWSIPPVYFAASQHFFPAPRLYKPTIPRRFTDGTSKSREGSKALSEPEIECAAAWRVPESPTPMRAWLCYGDRGHALIWMSDSRCWQIAITPRNFAFHPGNPLILKSRSEFHFKKATFQFTNCLSGVSSNGRKILNVLF